MLCSHRNRRVEVGGEILRQRLFHGLVADKSSWVCKSLRIEVLAGLAECIQSMDQAQSPLLIYLYAWHLCTDSPCAPS